MAMGKIVRLLDKAKMKFKIMGQSLFLVCLLFSPPAQPLRLKLWTSQASELLYE